jgi:pimeloyl-ACP methyl ester carboxylesterase
VKVFLIHGMGRSPLSFALLARRLERAGFSTSTFGYSVRTEDLRTIAARFTEHVRARAEGPWAVVGHSLGNVITRLASPQLPAGFERFVMLAPPNRPARLATLLRERLLFRMLTGDAGQRLGDPGFYAELPVPAVPTLIFAGTVGPRARWLPFGGLASDGIVAVEETRLPGAEHREIATIHTVIMNNVEVAGAIVDFLRERRRIGG